MRKILIYNILFYLSLLLIESCSGQIDPDVKDVKLTLIADKSEIVADGTSQVIFTVMDGASDVTSASNIVCSQIGGIVSRNTFTTSIEGVYTFTASYEGKTSDPVMVTAVAPNISRFGRRVCVMEFTGTWCSQCPSGATAITYLVEEAYKGKAFAMAFHNEDEYQIPQEQELRARFRINEYPAFLIDMRDSGLILEGGCSMSIEKSLYEMETHCGAALKCTSVDNGNGAINVTADARMFSEKTMEYRMAVYVVEDKVRGEQILWNNEVDEDYVHRHVVRKMLSSNIAGDDLGNVTSGSEVTRKYEFTVDSTWCADNLSVAVLILDQNGNVNNMAICSCLDGEMDYELIENK